MENTLLSQLGPYRLSKSLGSGSNATVRLGIHQLTGAKVAVKIVEKARSRNSSRVALRIQREIAALRELAGHPHILKLVDFFETKSFYAIVTECISGGSLGDLIRKAQKKNKNGDAKKGGLSPEVTFRVFHQVVSALEMSHAFGIAHRDLKPDNILLDVKQQNRAVLVDYGLCIHSSAANHGLHALETRCGSPLYAAPEVIRGEKYNGRAADVWSLGIVLYAMATGKCPFYDENIPRLLRLICNGDFEIPAHLPVSLRDLLAQMLCGFHPNRITIPEIKAHRWWLENCEKYKLSPVGAVPPPPSQSGGLYYGSDDQHPSGSTLGTTGSFGSSSMSLSAAARRANHIGQHRLVSVITNSNFSEQALSEIAESDKSLRPSSDALAYFHSHFRATSSHPSHHSPSSELKLSIGGDDQKAQEDRYRMVEGYRQLRVFSSEFSLQHSLPSTPGLADMAHTPQSPKDIALAECMVAPINPVDPLVVDFMMASLRFQTAAELTEKLKAPGASVEKSYYEFARRNKSLLASLGMLPLPPMAETCQQQHQQSPATSPRDMVLGSSPSGLPAATCTGGLRMSLRKLTNSFSQKLRALRQSRQHHHHHGPERVPSNAIGCS